MRRFGSALLRICAFAALLLVLAFVAATVLTQRDGDRALFPPRPGEESVAVYVVAQGYHASILLPVNDLLVAADEGVQAVPRLLPVTFRPIPISSLAGAMPISTVRFRHLPRWISCQRFGLSRG